MGFKQNAVAVAHRLSGASSGGRAGAGAGAGAAWKLVCEPNRNNRN